MKRVLTSCLVVLICLTAFITGYCKGCYSYADTVTYMTDEELEAGINAYIEAKGGSMLGTVGARMAYAEGKLYNFLTSSDNATPIKTIEDLKSGLSWNRQAIEGMDSKEALMLSVTPTANSFLASYLVWLRQQHYFGDNVSENENGMFNDGVDNELYSGQYFVDADGIGCLVYIASNDDVFNQLFSSMGTPYKYTTQQIINLVGTSSYTFTFNLNSSQIYNKTLNYYTKYNVSPRFDSIQINDSNTWGSGNIFYTRNYLSGQFDFIRDKDGQFCIINFDGTYYLCKLSLQGSNNINPDSTYKYRKAKYVEITNTEEIENNTNIIFYTNNNNNISVFPTINEGDMLYITPKVNVGVDGEVNYQPYIINEGDTISNVVNNYYTDSGTKDKTITVPSDNTDNGGGGSSDNPSGGTPPDWSNNFPHLSPDGEGGFNFNFTLPDLNIDWNINGLTEKFPFSIPFDLIHFVQVLNAEPETPEFDWTIDLKIYQWNIEADLHQFDNLASIVRNVEFIGFCITLVMITRRMIKG